MDLEKLAQLRRNLVSARGDLRRLEASREAWQAKTEQIAIADAGGDSKLLGANEADRKRALVVALADSASYREDLRILESMRREVDTLTAEIEILMDERREVDRASRDRLADALSENAKIRGSFMRADDLVGVNT